MQWQERFRRAQAEWTLLTLYERFEQVVILILTGLIAIVVVFAVWNLGLKIFHAVRLPQTFDPTDYSVFQADLRRDLHRHYRARVQAVSSRRGRNDKKASCRCAR